MPSVHDNGVNFISPVDSLDSISLVDSLDFINLVNFVDLSILSKSIEYVALIALIHKSDGQAALTNVMYR